MDIFLQQEEWYMIQTTIKIVFCPADEKGGFQIQMVKKLVFGQNIEENGFCRRVLEKDVP